jgi:hypothetical protein
MRFVLKNCAAFLFKKNTPKPAIRRNHVTGIMTLFLTLRQPARYTPVAIVPVRNREKISCPGNTGAL